MKTIACLMLMALPVLMYGQSIDFSSYYQQYSNLPSGILEAVAWTNTRMKNIDDSYQESCTGMPLPYGIMGVFDDGKEYFKENGKLIAQISGQSVEQQKANVAIQVEAYARAFSSIYQSYHDFSTGERIYMTLAQLSEIPDDNGVNLYARDSQIFEIMSQLKDEGFAAQFGTVIHDFSLTAVFGAKNTAILKSDRVIFTEDGIQLEHEVYAYQPKLYLQTKGPDYGPAIWDPTPACNHSGARAASSITAVTIHTAQGSYAGTISWAKNCSSNVSYHYVLRSSDGQVTQMLNETTFGWHVGSANSYTIGYEHEGFAEEAGWYTEAMYNSSAAISRNIADNTIYDAELIRERTYFGTSQAVLGGCVRIKGHVHYPNQTHTDPGVYWDWEKYYKLINELNYITYTDASGDLYDTGGPNGNYGNDERNLWVIAPPNATEVVLSFSAFELEDNWDYMKIYDGDTPNAPIIGTYTGNNSPGVVTANSGKMLVEFRSDCATTKAGWVASWIANGEPEDTTPPVTTIALNNEWQTGDFQANFIDEDEESGIRKGLYLVEYEGNGGWESNRENGFFSDNFESENLMNWWTVNAGDWHVDTGVLSQTDEGSDASNLSVELTQNLSNMYVYSWSARISGEGTNRRAGLHFFSEDPTLENGGQSYMVYFRANSEIGNGNLVQIYKVQDDELSLVVDNSFEIHPDQWYDFTIAYDRITGEMYVWVDAELAATWVDPNPIEDGGWMSFRNGNAVYEIQQVKVFRSRYPEVMVSVGPGTATDIPVQSYNGNHVGRISSLAIDNAGNISEETSEMVKIDWSQPIIIKVNDGTGQDIDTSYSATLYANWEAIDGHSGIANYIVGVGTVPGEDGVVAFENLGENTSGSFTVADPVLGMRYYITVIAENGAGLTSTGASDGQVLLEEELGIANYDVDNYKVYPNPFAESLVIEGSNVPSRVKIIDPSGKIVLIETINHEKQELSTVGLSAGIYLLVVESESNTYTLKIVKN